MTIVSTSPVQGAVNISQLTTISVLFDSNLLEASIDSSSVVVSAKSTHLFTVKNQTRTNNIFETEDFFNPDFTSIIEGVITISAQKTLVFTPSFKLAANTEYTVYLSQAISDTASNLLGEIYSFTFTTSEIDVVVPITVPTAATNVIGSTIEWEKGIIAETGLTVTRTIPSNLSFLNNTNVIKIYFSAAPGTITQDNLTILYGALLSDYPATILDQSLFTISVSGSVLTITITDGTITDNMLIDVTLSGITTSDYNFCYTSLLDPYYTSVKLLRLKAGTVLTSVNDLNIALTILYMSAQASALMRACTFLTGNDYLYIQANLTLFMALEALLMNNYSFQLNDFIKQQLSEFSVSLSNGAKIKIYNMLIDEAKEYKRAFKAMVTSKHDSTPVKGYYSLSFRQGIGRQWYRGIQPGINSVEEGKMIFDETSIPDNFENL